MAWQVKWTEVAQDDLNRIASYIAKDSPNYAAAFVREALDAACSLEHLAQRGRVVPEWYDMSIRELIVGNYRLIYQLEQPTASISVLYMAHAILRLFGKEKGVLRLVNLYLI